MVRYLAMLRDGVAKDPECKSDTDTDTSGGPWPVGATSLRTVAPFFPGKAPHTNHPYAYLFEGETRNLETPRPCHSVASPSLPGSLVTSNLKMPDRAAEMSSVDPFSSARTTPSDFTSYFKSKLDGTSADTIDQDLKELLFGFSRMMSSLRETSPNIFFTVTKGDGRSVVYASEWVEALTGYAPEDFIGRDFSFLQGRGTDTGTIHKIRKKALEAPHEPVEVVILNYKKDGTPFWKLLNIIPIMDEVGQVKAFLGTHVDVTDVVECNNAAFTENGVVEFKQRKLNTRLNLNPLPRRGVDQKFTSESEEAYAPLQPVEAGEADLESNSTRAAESDPPTIGDHRESFEPSDSPSVLDKSDGDSHFLIRLLFMGLLLQVLASQFDYGAVSICLGLITKEFTLSPLEQGLLGSAQAAGQIFSSIPSAQVIDWWPTKTEWCLLIANIVNSAACLGFAEAPNVPVLIGARFMVGLSEGFILMYTPLFAGLRFRSSASVAAALYLAARVVGILTGFGVAASFLGAVSAGMPEGANTVDGAWSPLFRCQAIVVFGVACLSSLLPTRLWDVTESVCENDSGTTMSGSLRIAATFSFCSKLGELCCVRLWVLLAISYCALIYWVSFWGFWNIELVRAVWHKQDVDLGEAAALAAGTIYPAMVISGGIFALIIDRCIGYEGPAALRKCMFITFVSSAFAMVTGHLVLPWIFEYYLWVVLVVLTFVSFAGLAPIFLALIPIVLPPHLCPLGVALSNGALAPLGGAMGTFLPGAVMQIIKDANGWVSVLSLDVQNQTKYANATTPWDVQNGTKYANATTAADALLLLTMEYREQQAILWRQGGLQVGNFALTVCAITTLAMWRIVVKRTRGEEEPRRRSTLGALNSSLSSSRLQRMGNGVPQWSCVGLPAVVQEPMIFKRRTTIRPMPHPSRGGGTKAELIGLARALSLAVNGGNGVQGGNGDVVVSNYRF